MKAPENAHAATSAPGETDSTAPVDIRLPARQTLPLVLASPHSGRDYSPEFIAESQLDRLTLRRSEDAFVDDVFAAAPMAGAPLVCAVFPRAFIDPNREPWELDPAMFDGALPRQTRARSERVRAGFGTIPRFVATGAEIYGSRIPTSEATKRVETLYQPYHAALAGLVNETRAQFGACLLLDCHSMPSIGGPSDRDAGKKRKDIVLGDRYGAACGSELMAAAETIIRDLGLSVARNEPYAGAYTTEHYGQPKTGVHAIQVEVNRGLYMNEQQIERLPALKTLATTMRTFIARLGQAVGGT